MLLSCADRLKNERKRVKLTQQNLALKIDVSDMTVKRWEAGTPIPSDKLELLAKFGFDIAFIITGEQSQASLNSDEAILLSRYRQADAATKNKILMLLLSGDTVATGSVVNQSQSINNGVQIGHNSGSVKSHK